MYLTYFLSKWWSRGFDKNLWIYKKGRILTLVILSVLQNDLGFLRSVSLTQVISHSSKNDDIMNIVWGCQIVIVLSQFPLLTSLTNTIKYSLRLHLYNLGYLANNRSSEEGYPLSGYRNTIKCGILLGEIKSLDLSGEDHTNSTQQHCCSVISVYVMFIKTTFTLHARAVFRSIFIAGASKCKPNQPKAVE